MKRNPDSARGAEQGSRGEECELAEGRGGRLGLETGRWSAGSLELHASGLIRQMWQTMEEGVSGDGFAFWDKAVGVR